MKQISQVEISEKDISINFKSWCKKAFGEEDLDKIDILHNYDSTLNYSENKQMFKDKFSSLFCEEYKEEVNLKNAKEQEIAHKELMLSEIKKEELKLVEEWKKSDYQDIDIKSFDIVKNYIQLICRNKGHSGINGILLVGQTGLGKSFCVINTLKQEKIDFAYLNTWTTGLELYKYLYEQNGKVIIFDDVVNLLDNPKNIGVLQSALWEVNNKRIITNNTTDKVLQGVPKIFEFTGKIIIITNELKETDEHIKSIKERCIALTLNFTFNEKLKIMAEITQKPYKNTTIEFRKKALKLLTDNVDVCTENLNFRTLIRCYECMLFDEKKAKDMLKVTLNTDEEMQFIYDLMKSFKSVNEQISDYRLKFGKSPASYYRLKQKLTERFK